MANRLPSPRYGHFRSGEIFGTFRQNSSKIDHFSFGRMGLSFAVAEIRPLPVCGNFRDFSSKIVKKGNLSFGPMGLWFAVT
jgi:hypothetical protein